jgi:hypothetical protein
MSKERKVQPARFDDEDIVTREYFLLRSLMLEMVKNI